MDYFDRGGRRGNFCMLILLITCLALLHVQCAEPVSEEEYPMLLENQGSKEDLLDARSSLVSSLNRLLQQEEDEKRASSFYPLRGKKMPDPSITDNYQYMSDNEDKRSQFFPLRGKKIPSELKRVSYFMPMRGRKDGDIEEDQDKRASSFMPMRGKKSSDGASVQHYGKTGTYPSIKTEFKLPSNSEHISSRSKRMSSFVPQHTINYEKQESSNVTGASVDNPVRRKLNTTHMLYKRSVSFVPMRGRRLLSISKESSGNPGEIATSLVEKKYYSFMPMRGRRTSYYALKRPMSFFATRGKRMEDGSIERFSELP